MDTGTEHTMKCPACGQTIPRTDFRSLNPKARWYQMERHAPFCPKCDTQLAHVSDNWSRAAAFFQPFSMLIGMRCMLASDASEWPNLWIIGGALVLAGLIAYVAAMANRPLIVAPTGAVIGGDSN